MDSHWAEDELMALSAIYEDEIKINYYDSGDVSSLERTILPATADDLSTQFLKLDLKFTFPKEASHKDLKVEFASSRGLSDERLMGLNKTIQSRIDEGSHDGLLFDIMEITSNDLTLNNIPSDPCPICLIKFKIQDVFVKTSCFHHFHSYCLRRYMDGYEPPDDVMLALPRQQQLKMEEEKDHNLIPCPKCRKKIFFDRSELENCPEPFDDDDITEVDFNEIREKMKKMKASFERQKEKGGIIKTKEEKEAIESANEIVLHISRDTQRAPVYVTDPPPNNHYHRRHLMTSSTTTGNDDVTAANNKSQLPSRGRGRGRNRRRHKPPPHK